jgi:8-oxo-dGTP pyrophosphatase MutT (NUDIX family)
MVRGKTIGIATFRWDNNSPSYLLVHHGGAYWNFPKGRQESNETDIETALRELREETGVTKVKIIDGFREEYEYDFAAKTKKGEPEVVYKRAIFFLGEVLQADIKISDEHIDYGWFDYSAAAQQMPYQTSQNLLNHVHAFLLKQRDSVL